MVGKSASVILFASRPIASRQWSVSLYFSTPYRQVSIRVSRPVYVLLFLAVHVGRRPLNFSSSEPRSSRPLCSLEEAVFTFCLTLAHWGSFFLQLNSLVSVFLSPQLFHPLRPQFLAYSFAPRAQQSRSTHRGCSRIWTLVEILLV